MKTPVANQKCLVLILVVTVLIAFGTQGIGYGQERSPTITASVPQPLTEATLNGSVVTLTLSGGAYERWNTVRNNVTVSGIEGVTFRSSTDVERVSDTEVTVELAFNGNIDTDGTLIFTVGADAIVNYNGPALTAEIPVTAVAESVVASVPQPLTEATLNGSVVTLTLSGGAYERWNTVRNNVTVSGIEGVTFRSSTDVERVSDTEVTVELAFNGNIDTDGTLIFTVGADAIVNYNGPALTAEIPVTAVAESVVASTPQPLTEATLNESVVTLTLSGGAYERSIFDIGDAVTVSGIEGVTVGRKEPPKQDLPDGVCRVGQVVKSGEKCTYPGTSNDFWVDSAGRGHFIFFTAGNAVDARGTTINGVVYNFLARHQGGGSWIIEAAGGTAGTFGIERVSDTEVTVELAFNGNIDTDGTLIFTVGADAIAGYNGSVLTAEIPVTAVEKATPDFDGDGRVGFADFLQFAAHFGLSQGDEGYDARYDLDGDGAIGFGDFLIFANDFGKDLPATATITVMQPVVSVEVSSPAEPTALGEPLQLGETLQLSVEALDENGQVVAGVEFSWESSDAEVATVDASGLVTGVAEGTATITARVGEASGSAIVTVTPTFTLSGTVSDSRRTGLVLPGAVVQLENGRRESTTTGPDGRYRFPNVSGTVTVTVTVEPSYASQAVEVTVDANRALDFALDHTGTPPFEDAPWITPDILGPSDPSSLRGVTYAGRGMRWVWDDRLEDFVTINAYLFDVQFAEQVVEFVMNPEFGSSEAARAHVDTFTPAIGRLPALLVSGLREVWINAVQYGFAANSTYGSFSLGTDEATRDAVRDGFLEEILLHEGCACFA